MRSEGRRNPEQDFPADFDQHRDEHYQELRKPLVRVWARANGFTVSDRGRVSAEIMTAYQQRN